MFKKIMFVLGFSLTLYGMYVPSALALKAVFPNSAKLEPIPIYASPDISGNVNASLTPAFQSPSFGEETQQASTSIEPTNQPNVAPSFGFFWLIALSVIGLLVLITGIIFVSRF